MTVNASTLHVVISASASNVNSYSEGLAFKARGELILKVSYQQTMEMQADLGVLNQHSNFTVDHSLLLVAQ